MELTKENIKRIKEEWETVLTLEKKMAAQSEMLKAFLSELDYVKRDEATITDEDALIN